MILKRPWEISNAMIVFALFLVGSCCPGAQAQQSDNVATCISGWEWNQNSLGQDPCHVTSVLEAACRGIDSYGIPSVPSGLSYSPPRRDNSDDLACECDTVTYSLYMACARCQGEDRKVYPWLNYMTQCDKISIGLYPHEIPNGTAIPRWAFYDVTSIPNQTYDDNLAMSIGRDPEATPEPQGTGHSPRRKDIKKIVGGAVGGVAGLLIVVSVAAFIIRQRRKDHAQGTLAHFQGQPASPGPSANHFPNLYNPEDPNTFPPPMYRTQNPSIHTDTPSSHGQSRFSSTPWM